tara:strand:- start:6447 stop:6821 length:375 start_codon:yes stop_codon:yes gene_type:complete
LLQVTNLPMRFLTWIIAIPVALIIVIFAISNRTPALIDLSPLPFLIDVPIWAIAVGAVLFGIIVGSTVRWLLDHRRRLLANSRAKKLKSAEKEILLLRKKIAKLEKLEFGKTSQININNSKKFS